MSDDDERKRLGSSGVFKVLVETAQKVKRALTEGDSDIKELGAKIGQAFVAGRFGDVYQLTTSGFQKRNTREAFERQWADAVKDRGPLTSFSVNNAGQIDIGFIPGLEEVPQADFEAMVQIAFASPSVPLDDEKAFTIAVVLLDDDGEPRIGAMHTS